MPAAAQTEILECWCEGVTTWAVIAFSGHCNEITTICCGLIRYDTVYVKAFFPQQMFPQPWCQMQLGYNLWLEQAFSPWYSWLLSFITWQHLSNWSQNIRSDIDPSSTYPDPLTISSNCTSDCPCVWAGDRHQGVLLLITWHAEGRGWCLGSGAGCVYPLCRPADPLVMNRLPWRQCSPTVLGTTLKAVATV